MQNVSQVRRIDKWRDVSFSQQGGRRNEQYYKMNRKLKATARPVVEILEGPSAGTTKDFAKNKLQFINEAGSASAPPTVPPAGIPAPTADEDARSKASRAAAFQQACYADENRPKPLLEGCHHLLKTAWRKKHNAQTVLITPDMLDLRCADSLKSRPQLTWVSRVLC